MKRVRLAIVVMLAVVSIMGCGASGLAKSERNYNDSTYSVDGAFGDSTYPEDAYVGEVGAGYSAMEPIQTPEMATGISSTITSGAPIQEFGRKLITELTMSMETTDIDSSVATISNAVKDLGGYLQSSSFSGNSLNSAGGLRYADMVIRIPQATLAQLLEITDQAGNIVRRSESIRDITLQYVDTEDRIKTLQIEQERLWELLGKAESIESIIALEQRLSDIRYELESYKSQLRAFDDQVDYATIYLDISEVRIYSPQTQDGIGQRISKGFKENLTFLTDGAVELLIYLITHLPNLFIFAVIVLFVVFMVKRTAKKKAHQLIKEKSETKTEDPKSN